MDASTWMKINNFVEISEYPELTCPYCEHETLQLEQTSYQARPIHPKYKEFAKRHYEDPAQKKLERWVETGKGVASMAKESPGWALAFGILAIADEYQRDNVAISQCICFFQCTHCQGIVTAQGLAQDYYPKGSQTKSHSTIKFEYFSPTIPLLATSLNTPQKIKRELFDAFSHYHFDPASAASKLRRAMERFCEDMKAEGKNLHQQISSLKKQHPEEASYLEALKLVGNEGTHSDNVDEQDLTSAFRVFQVVLELYDRRARYQSIQNDLSNITTKYDVKASLSLDVTIEKNKQLQNHPTP